MLNQLSQQREPAWRTAHYAQIGRFAHKLHNNAACPGADITVKLADSSLVMLHSEVAGAHSGYFAQILLGLRTPTTIDAIHYPERPELIRRAIDFMYSGSLGTIDFPELPGLLHIADMWRMSGLKELLESWLVRLSTDPKLVLSCLNVSTCHDTNVHIPSFEAVLFNAVRHLEHILKDPRLPQLSAGSIYALIAQGLRSRTEATKAYVLLHYLRGNPSFADNHFDAFIRLEKINDKERNELALLAAGFNLHVLASKLSRPKDPLSSRAQVLESASGSIIGQEPLRLSRPAYNGALDAMVHRRPAHAHAPSAGPLVSSLSQLEVAPQDSNAYVGVLSRQQEAAQRARTTTSIHEVNDVPNLFMPRNSNVNAQSSHANMKCKRELSSDSLRELEQIPDIGVAHSSANHSSSNGERVFYLYGPGRYSRPFSGDSVRELRALPSLTAGQGIVAQSNYPTQVPGNAASADDYGGLNASGRSSASDYFRSPYSSGVGSYTTGGAYNRCGNYYVPTAASLEDRNRLPDVFTNRSSLHSGSRCSQSSLATSANGLARSVGSSSYFRSPSASESDYSRAYARAGNYYVPSAASLEDRGALNDLVTFNSTKTARSASEHSQQSGAHSAKPQQ